VKPAMQEPLIKINQSIPLIKYQLKEKEKKTKNLIDSLGDVPAPKEKEEEETEE
jgi:hypothetical protein